MACDSTQSFITDRRGLSLRGRGGAVHRSELSVGRYRHPGRRQFLRVLAAGYPGRAAAVRSCRSGSAGAGDRTRSAHPPHLPLLARVRARVGAGQVYAYRAFGPFDPGRGLRFDPSKVVLDPYGRAVVVPQAYSRQRSSQYGQDDANAMKSVVVDPGAYDWEGDVPLRRSYASTVIYEMHVAGFTRHPSSGLPAELRGTYAGMIEKIPYLQDLGITAVELLPIFQFDRQDCPPGLVNYWGYSPVSFFAPHAGYSSRKDALGPVDEFRDLVKALHRAGIEVILDVVFNHTAEGSERGRRSVSAASATKSTTSSTRTARATPITAAPATR